MGTAPIVTIHLTGPLRRVFRGRDRAFAIDASTVKAALEELERQPGRPLPQLCDETGALRRHLNVFVNADNIRDLAGVDTTSRRETSLTFLPAVSGG